MKKRRRKNSKKYLTILVPICIVLLLALLIFVGYNLIFKERTKKFLETIDTTAYVEINSYAIYGIHMNLEGTFTLPGSIEDVKLVLTNGDYEQEIPWNLKQDNNSYTFQTSEYINEGINLEKLPTGEYYLLIKTTNQDENNNPITKYYSLENNSDYKDLEYYTLTKDNKNNKIDIEWNTYEQFPTLRFHIYETELPEDVYDITIDPGHDASDPGKSICLNGNNIYDPDYYGYCYNGGTLYTESDFNLEISQALKTKLESLGYKVTMTRNTLEDYVEIYDPMGSATMANDTKSKFNFAIHHNSSGVNGGLSYLNGTEIYIANDTNLDLAETFMQELIDTANTAPSYKSLYKVADGIYQRFFTEEEIAEDDVQPSNKTTDTIYYYYIREVGGISTHATNDGRYSPTYPKNEHYNSNNTAEPYLFELGYIDNLTDLQNMINNQSGYADAIANALQKYLEEEK